MNDFHIYHMERLRRRATLQRLLEGRRLGTRGAHQLLMGGGGAASDPYYSNVTALLHFNGSNGGTTFTDEKGHTFSKSGSATRTTDTGAPKFGTASMKNTAFNDSALYCSASTDFACDAAFTIEAWVRYLAINDNGLIWSLTTSGGVIHSGLYTAFTSGNLKFYDTGTNATSYSFSNDGSYHHVAQAQEGGSGSTLRVFVDGNVVYTGTGPTNRASTGIYLGYNGSFGIYGYNGYMDDFRFTKGICRYTAAFTPATAQWPDS